MKTPIKKVVAREFLIVFGIVILTLGSYFFIVLRSRYVVNRISEVELEIENKNLRKDSLLSDSMDLKPHEFSQWETIIRHDPLKIFPPPLPPPFAHYKVSDPSLLAELNSTASDGFIPPEVVKQHNEAKADSKPTPSFVPDLPDRPWGCCEIVEDYKPFTTPPDISNDFLAFKQARINLIALHRVLITEALHYKRDSAYYTSNYQFNSFVSNLNNAFLSRLHQGLLGKSKEFYPVCDIPEKFNSFCLSIGVDTNRYELISNLHAESLHTEIAACDSSIDNLLDEKGELLASSFRSIDTMNATLNVLLLLLSIAYGIRGIWLMTTWSIRTLKEKSH